MSQKNKEKIQENRRKIFELDVLVNSNKTKVEVCRAAVEQNYTAIMRNYNAAYMGNHNLLNQNSEEILRNRLAILGNMVAETSVETDFRESMNNMAQLDFLEHKSQVNKTVLEVNKLLSEINSKLIEINRIIMRNNESSLNFNKKNLDQNKKFLDGEFHPSKATDEDNEVRSQQNSDRCAAIEDVASKNLQKILEVQTGTERNAIDILKNAVQISERRENINSVQEEINKNQSEVAEMISVRIKD